jgi:hypothetical protein
MLEVQIAVDVAMFAIMVPVRLEKPYESMEERRGKQACSFGHA